MMMDRISTVSRTAAHKRKAARPVLKMEYVTVISVILVLLCWEYFGRQINPIFASYPSAIALAFWKLLKSGALVKAFLESIQPLAAGYFLAVAVGVPLGLLIGRYRIVEAAINIYVVAGYSTPLVAIMPLFLLWFGLGFAVKVAIIFTLTVFPIIINTSDGVKQVPKALIEVGKAFVASQQGIMRKIIIPATIPYIMTGLRLGIGKAIIAMIIAEFFSSISGLGGIIINAGNSFQTANMFVPVVILMLMGVGLTRLVGWVERKIAPWQQGQIAREE
jgi:NitT/TauT family transport system permease protein